MNNEELEHPLELEELLNEIANARSDIDIKQVYEKFKVYFHNIQSPNYAQITKFVYEVKDVSFTMKNLEELISSIEQNEMELKEKINKIISHINLEDERENHIKNELLGEMSKEIDAATKRASELENKAEILENKINNYYTEIISIIGIFSAIVIVFFSGTSFIGSMVSSMENVSKYRLFFTLSLSGIIFYNVVVYFMKFLMTLRLGKKDEKQDEVSGVNIVLGFVMFLAVVFWAINKYTSWNI